MNYTAMGDAVNLAARLEALNKQYGTRVMISGVTHDAIGDELVARAVDLVAVKGKKQGVRVFEPLAMNDNATDTDRALARASRAALDAYVAREFDDAADEWREVLKLRPGDAVAMRMLDQAMGYAGEPPPMDWSGVHFARKK